MFTKKEVFDKFTVRTIFKWLLIIIVILYALGIIVNRILFQWEFWMMILTGVLWLYIMIP